MYSLHIHVGKGNALDGVTYQEHQRGHPGRPSRAGLAGRQDRGDPAPRRHLRVRQSKRLRQSSITRLGEAVQDHNNGYEAVQSHINGIRRNNMRHTAGGASFVCCS